MQLIGELRDKIAAGQFEFSKHATDQSIKRDVIPREAKEAIHER